MADVAAFAVSGIDTGGVEAGAEPWPEFLQQAGQSGSAFCSSMARGALVKDGVLI
jgi:hypothetical protein